MTTPKIEVRAKQKTLSLGGRTLTLEDNFEGGGVFDMKNSKGESINETLLELNYRKRKGFVEMDEQEKVYEFLDKKFEVYSSRAEDFSREVFPAVQITGKFNAVVYNE